MRISRITVALLLLVISGLTIGCNGSSSGLTPQESPSIAKVTAMHTAAVGDEMEVFLTPTESASPNKLYIVEVFEKGKLRYQTTVYWTQPEINILKSKIVYFPLNSSEHDTYWYADDVSHIFSIQVHE